MKQGKIALINLGVNKNLPMYNLVCTFVYICLREGKRLNVTFLKKCSPVCGIVLMDFWKSVYFFLRLVLTTYN